MKKILSVLIALPLAADAASVAAPINIGVASAVRGLVKASVPGGPAGRVVETGKAVYARDKVVTGPDAKLQVLLLDQTSFTMGPNSEMELDEFVFDPNTSVGKVSAKITKGAFRFVTGKVARRDPAAMQVTTPVGTIGIRGTMTAGTVDATEATIVLLGPGPNNNADEKPGGITVTNGAGSVTVDQDGYAVTVKAGEAPSAPFKMDQAQFDALLAGVNSAPTSDAKDDSDSASGGADSESGQDTANGTDNAGDAFAVIDAAQAETGQFAAQAFSAPSQATWDEVREVTGGTGRYSGSASNYACDASGSSCGGAAVGTTSFNLFIDFGAKTIGGSGSTIEVSQAGSATSINAHDYSALSGDARMALSLFGSGSGSYINGAGTSLKLLNASGVTAGAITVDVRWTNDVDFFGGAVGGNLQQ
jgi:hypothetical protein